MIKAQFVRRVIFALVFLSAGISCGPVTYMQGSVQYSVPSWGPPGYAHARYYYLPDIEVYYDLSIHEFVYLQNGHWVFSYTLPPPYVQYDLFTGFVIILNSNVFEPWMHHQYYLAHYPRYYYHSYYPGRSREPVWGFNENSRQPFYWTQADKDHLKDRRNAPSPKKVERPVRPPQNPVYSGKNIGRPVRVRPEMRQKNRPTRKKNNRGG